MGCGKGQRHVLLFFLSANLHLFIKNITAKCVHMAKAGFISFSFKHERTNVTLSSWLVLFMWLLLLNIEPEGIVMQDFFFFFS